ncbi:pentapeptide repeat-containing protein [Amycolatopsis sp. NPDC058340]|uniref:pentapeptide repeat-containing protein n=1 Tax=Amycolatopsis sp. NPDC058340 TaxID=3346453 RepID=UPI003647FF06
MTEESRPPAASPPLSPMTTSSERRPPELPRAARPETPAPPGEPRPATRPIPGWVIPAGIPVMLLVAVGAVWLMLGIGVDGTKLEVIRTGGTLGVGLGGVLVLWLGIRRQRSTELDLLAKYEAHELAERTAANTLAHQQEVAADARADAAARRITELYTKAVEQLGSDKAPVRLGGLYALERLAQDNETQRQTIVNVLCAYLRMPFEHPEPPPADADAEHREQHRTLVQEREVRLAAQRILTSHLKSDRGETYWGERDLDLTGAQLIDFDLGQARIGSSTFRHATFTGIAGFYQATFTGHTRFDMAAFTSSTTFFKATFSRASQFDGATFTGIAVFDETNFARRAFFRRVNFVEAATFNETTFEDFVLFTDAVFASGTKFNEAVFNGNATFTGAAFARDAEFNATTFAGDVTFDEATLDREPLEPPGRP